MKLNIVTINEAKTKKAALNQSIYCLQQLEILSKRKENIMNNKNQLQEKINKLTETLAEYSKQLEEIDTTSSDWKRALTEIQSKWNLTESEILELRSSLLREKISELQKTAEISDTGKSKLV